MGRRVIWIVIDSVGAGMLPDADRYGDAGADTIGHILDSFPDTDLPNMARLGLYEIDGTSFKGKKSVHVEGCYGRSLEKSKGKDTTTGHWEMIGIYTKKPFPTYPDGFPKEIIDEFIERTGCGGIYGNKVASGVPIIGEYGEKHMKTGYPIIYTSADSVFQIAASEEKVGLDKLYEMCHIARELLQGEHAVGRVIARPFVRVRNASKDAAMHEVDIKPIGGFERTANRRDFALEPDRNNILTHIKDAGKTVAAVGKISDIFANVGITDEIHTTGNSDGLSKTLDYMQTVQEGLIFTNLVDFDMKFGHRRDTLGYRNALVEFDNWLGENLYKLKEDDILIINSDHGCDPTYKGSDHTREYIPVLIYGKNLEKNVNLGTLSSFADIGKTVEDYILGANAEESDKLIGESFLKKIYKENI
ncbi:MAG: phosphopentomutase [Lachnospiraceae bacterium]|nr:phosphopentomutase [Lachnospiraceae bacterium]